MMGVNCPCHMGNPRTQALGPMYALCHCMYDAMAVCHARGHELCHDLTWLPCGHASICMHACMQHSPITHGPGCKGPTRREVQGGRHLARCNAHENASVHNKLKSLPGVGEEYPFRRWRQLKYREACPVQNQAYVHACMHPAHPPYVRSNADGCGSGPQRQKTVTRVGVAALLLHRGHLANTLPCPSTPLTSGEDQQLVDDKLV